VHRLLWLIPLIFAGVGTVATPTAADDKESCKVVGGCYSAADQADDRAACEQTKGDETIAIAACTRVILAANLLGSLLADTYYMRGTQYRRSGELDSAIADYDQAITLNPSLAEAYDGRADAFSGKGAVDRSIADYTQLILLNPYFADAHYKRGLAYRSTGELDRAIADYDEAIKERLERFIVGEVSSLDVAWVYESRGEAFESKEDFDRAIADY
jgi:tetratricopeptide (TPR) repeat protein